MSSETLNFEVFEGLVGSAESFGNIILGLVVAIVFLRVGITFINQFKLVQKEDMTTDDYASSLLFLLIYLFLFIAFLYF